MRLFPGNSRATCAQLLLRPNNREAQTSAKRRPVWPAPSGRSPEKSGPAILRPRSGRYSARFQSATFRDTHAINWPAQSRPSGAARFRS